jgi:TolB protein
MNKLFYNSLISKLMPLILVFSISICGTFAVGKPLKIEINKETIEPLPLALPSFVAENNLLELAENLTSVIFGDLQGTGLFKIIEDRTRVFEITNFNNPIRFGGRGLI